jgi:hypothetical protein
MFLGQRQGLPAAGLGLPRWWGEKEILEMQGQSTVPATNPFQKHYGLARFAFSLRPKERQQVRRAEFTVYLHAKGDNPRPVFYDLFPYAEAPVGHLKIGVGSAFKFTDSETALASYTTTISLKQNVPVAGAEGIGTSTACWVLTPTAAYPLIGIQEMYAVVELPPGVQGARVTVHLLVEVVTAIGPVRGFLPRTEHAALGWALE